MGIIGQLNVNFKHDHIRHKKGRDIQTNLFGAKVRQQGALQYRERSLACASAF